MLALALTLAGTLHAAEVSAPDRGHAYNPSWSPDGQYVAFELNKFEGSVDLYVVKLMNGNPVGAPQKVVLPGATSAFSASGSVSAAPNWHPKGMLIFEGSNPGGTNRLYFWQPGGQSAAELLSNGQIPGDLSWPTVSPDGKMVAFVSDSTGSGDIYVWDRSTNKVTQALTSPFSEAAPRYSADATKIAYSRKNQGSEDLFILEGGTPVPLVGGNGDQTRPVWSGAAVVYFTSERGEEHWDIGVSDGPGKKRVVARDVRLPLRAAPALTPDGQWLVYGLADPEQAKNIMFTSVDGSRTVKIETGVIAAGEPAVQKVGDRIFLAFTALPADGADWRQLHVVDVTDKLR